MKQYCIELLIVLAVLCWGGISLRDGGDGIAWDEPFYLYAGAQYIGLHSTVSNLPGGRWAANAEHPPLAKLCIGMGEVVGVLLYAKIGFLTGGRMAVVFLFALLLVGVYRLALPLGRHTALLAVLLCAMCPRFLGHARLATLDVPMAAAWVWTVLLFERMIRAREAKQPVAGALFLAGVVFGCALLTKFTAVLLPCVLGGWILLRAVSFYLYGAKTINSADESPDQQRLWRDLLLLAAVVGIGVAVFFVGWPWLWTDTTRRTGQYLGRSLSHGMAPLLYAGTMYGQTFGKDAPPWHYAPVMLALTTPLMVTLGVLLSCVRDRLDLLRGRILFLCVLGAAALPLATMLPGSVAYDGVRLLLPAIPLTCILSAHGWIRFSETMARWIRSETATARLRSGVLGVALVLVVFGRVAVAEDLSYYTLAVGGTSGAKQLGMETAYWATAFRPEALRKWMPFINKDTRLRCVGFGSLAPLMWKDLGLLPEDVLLVQDETWDVALVVSRHSLTGVDALLASPRVHTVRTISAHVWPTEVVVVGSLFCADTPLGTALDKSLQQRENPKED